MGSVVTRVVVIVLIVAGLLAGYAVAAPAGPQSSAVVSRVQAAQPAASPTVTMTANGETVLTAPPKGERPEVSGDQTLVMAGSSQGPETLDPALVRDAESSFYVRQVFRGLVKLDNDMQVQPDIAERIVISADGRTYTFHLRPNAIFHNGAPIDADAVADSLNRAADPDLADGAGFDLPAAIYLIDIEGAAERLAGSADTISGIQVVDATTLRISLTKPAANFLYKLTGSPAHIVDVAWVAEDDWWQEPNGSGPFQLGPWSASELVLNAFEEFYDGAPLLDRVVIRLGTAAAQPLNLYEAGTIDVTEVPFYAVDRVLSETDTLHDDLVVVPQLSTSFIVLNANERPFDDPAIREAVVAAFDREKVAEVMLDGKVELAAGLVPPGILDREWPSETRAYDVDQALELIRQAGELDVPPVFYGSGAAVSLAVVLERDLGIDVNAIGLDWPAFTTRLTERSLPAYSLTWIADFPDPSNFLTAMFLTGSPDNYSGYSNLEVDRLLMEAEAVQDPDERAELYRKAQQLILDDHVLIPLYHDVSYTVVQPYVQGLVVSPIGILALEDIWLDD